MPHGSHAPKEPGNVHENYVTPERLCTAALNSLPETFTPRIIIDPGAGSGRWGKAARAKWGTNTAIYAWEIDRMRDRITNADGHDIRLSTYTAIIEEDYTTPLNRKPCELDHVDLICGNPPFSLWQPFVERSLQRLAPGGILLFVLPLNLWASAGRRAFWRTSPPDVISVCIPRPTFTEHGSNNSEYAAYRWSATPRGITLLAHLDWKADPQ